MSTLVRLSVALMCVLSAAAVSAQTQAPKLQGVWKIVEVRTSGPDASTNTAPQPGLVIISAKHYSMTSISADAPRPRLPADASKATADQLRATWESFFAHAGTYALSADKITYSSGFSDPLMVAIVLNVGTIPFSFDSDLTDIFGVCPDCASLYNKP